MQRIKNSFFSFWATLPTCLAIFSLWLCLLETNVWLLFIEAEKPVELSIYRVSSEKFNPDASLRHFDLLIQFTHQYISIQITPSNITNWRACLLSLEVELLWPLPAWARPFKNLTKCVEFRWNQFFLQNLRLKIRDKDQLASLSHRLLLKIILQVKHYIFNICFLFRYT